MSEQKDGNYTPGYEDDFSTAVYYMSDGELVYVCRKLFNAYHELAGASVTVPILVPPMMELKVITQIAERERIKRGLKRR